MPSAVGDLQIFAVQTNRTELIINIFYNPRAGKRPQRFIAAGTGAHDRLSRRRRTVGSNGP